MRSRSNALLFIPIFLMVAAVDVVTKGMAERMLSPQRLPHDILNGVLRFTLVYNPGAAFGLNLGQHSRWIFTGLTLVALVILGRLYFATRQGDYARTLALAFVCAGAIGNLLDRLRSGLGVVDFLDVGIGDARWPTFNVADMAVSVGAILLALVLWQEDRATALADAQELQSFTPVAQSSPGEQGEVV